MRRFIACRLVHARLLPSLLLAGALFLPARPAHAGSRFFLGGHLQTAVPRGEWSDGLLAIAPGLSWELGLTLRPLPITIGAEAGFAVYEWSEESQPVALSLPNGRVSKVDATVDRYSSMLFGHVFARLQPAWGRVRPFVEVLYGMKRLKSEVEVQNPWNDGDTLSSETTFADSTWSRGYGIGLEWGGRHETRFTLGARFLRGGPVDFGPAGPWPSHPEHSRPFVAERTDTTMLYLGFRGGGL